MAVAPIEGREVETWDFFGKQASWVRAARPVDVGGCSVLLVVRVEVWSCRKAPVVSAARSVHVPAVIRRVVESTQTHADRRQTAVQLHARISLNSTGPTRTPTWTLGMRLSCNFVNVYTIVYHAQYTYTCTRAHPQRTSSRGKARVGQKSADKSVRLVASSCSGARGRPTSARAAAHRADFRARIHARKSARKSVSVSVSVSVPWNLSYNRDVNETFFQDQDFHAM